jgi:ankyrin repeat protein
MIFTTATTLTAIREESPVLAMRDPYEGGTILHFLLWNQALGELERLGCMQAILESRPELCKVQDTLGRTPLHVLCLSDNWPERFCEALSALVATSTETPATITAKDSAGATPLHRLCANTAVHALGEDTLAAAVAAIVEVAPDAASILDCTGKSPTSVLTAQLSAELGWEAETPVAEARRRKNPARVDDDGVHQHLGIGLHFAEEA